MITIQGLSETLAIYTKHGWILRRVLLSPELAEVCGDSVKDVFGDAETVDSDLSAAWFSRPPQPGGVPWELRRLTNTPYALVENIDEASPDLEAALSEVEDRMRQVATGGESA